MSHGPSAATPKAAFLGLGWLAALLAVPFALRPPELSPDRRDETVVVLSPHNEAIRHEFSGGFRRYMLERHGRRVRIDWRSPGGTSEISRYLGAEFRSAFELHWSGTLKRPFNERVAAGFADPKQSALGPGEASRARREFLSSNVGVKVDVLFGGGSFDFSQHAAAGRLVDSGVIANHPELFNEQVIPASVGGEPYWDKQGRWIGACLSAFGICYNQAALSQLGIQTPPKRWADLADPRLAGHVALADPSKSGSATKAFEMILQQAMSEAVARRSTPSPGSPEEDAALAEGFEAGLRLIRRIAGNSRYFTDSALKIPLDVAAGNAAAGMCIDFYGRFQDPAPGQVERLSFVLPEAGSSVGSDPIALLRGAPSPELGRALIEFVLSPTGQALWAYRRGVPGGPERYALRRLPILPALYTPEARAQSSDAFENPYQTAGSFTYQGRFTGPLFRSLAFVVRVMCVDSEPELHEAWRELSQHGFPPRASALFDDVSAVSYATVKSEVASTLALGNPLAESQLQNRLFLGFRAQYQEVARLARSQQ